MLAVVVPIGVRDMNGAAVLSLCLTLFAGLAWCVGAVWELAARRSTD